MTFISFFCYINNNKMSVEQLIGKSQWRWPSWSLGQETTIADAAKNPAS